MASASESTQPELHRSGSVEAVEAGSFAGRIVGYFERRSPAVALLVASVAIAVLGLVDAFTGRELRFFVFYWPPIALVTWVAGRKWGLVTVLWSGLAWLLALLPFRGPAETPQVVTWNLIVNVASFAALAVGVAYIREMSDRQRTLALTDFMTGVPNARALLSALQGEIDRSRRHAIPLSLAYLDVDDFKSVNDSRGHEAGNELLRTIAMTIRSSLRTSDTVARLGGDEFAMILPESGLDEARGVVQRVLARLAEETGRRSWPVTFSVGLVCCTKAECTCEELLQRADALMYEAKSGGKNSLQALDLSPDRS